MTCLVPAGIVMPNVAGAMSATNHQVIPTVELQICNSDWSAQAAQNTDASVNKGRHEWCFFRDHE
jgi:hypothetical protein